MEILGEHTILLWAKPRCLLLQTYQSHSLEDGPPSLLAKLVHNYVITIVYDLIVLFRWGCKRQLWPLTAINGILNPVNSCLCKLT